MRALQQLDRHLLVEAHVRGERNRAAGRDFDGLARDPRFVVVAARTFVAVAGEREVRRDRSEALPSCVAFRRPLLPQETRHDDHRQVIARQVVTQQ